MSSKTKKASSRLKSSNDQVPTGSVSLRSTRGRARTVNKKAQQQSNLDWAMNATLGQLSGDDEEDAILGTGVPVEDSYFAEDWNLPTELHASTGAETAGTMYQQRHGAGKAAPAATNFSVTVTADTVNHQAYHTLKRPLDLYIAGGAVPAPTTDRTVSQHGSFQPHHKRKKGTKALAPPKRPLTGYNLFVRKERQQYPQSGGSALSKKWDSMSAEERQVYEVHAEQDVERYRREMAEYKRITAAPPPPVVLKGPPETPVDAVAASSSTVWTAPMMMGPPPPPPAAATAPYPRGGFAPMQETTNHRAPSGMVPFAPSSPYHAYPHTSHGHSSQSSSRHAVQETPASPSASRAESEGSTSAMTGPPPMGSVPLPSGTQIVMPDATGNLQKYVVNYAVWTMPESSAREYVQHILRMESQSGGKRSSGMVSIPASAIPASAIPASAIPASAIPASAIQHRSSLRSVSHPPASFASPSHCAI